MKKFKKLYLHAGLEKTGTTSIQRALDKHRGRVEKLGFFYPKATAVGKNILLGAMFCDEYKERPLFLAAVDKRGGDHEKFVAMIKDELAKEYESTSATSLILSSEFIAGHTNLKKLRDYCDSIAEETEFVLYLREQSALLMSLYSTYIKSGGIEFGTFGQLDQKALPSFLNYRMLVERAEDSFPGNVTLRIFDRKKLRGGDVIKDFLEVVGLHQHEDDIQVARQNESLSVVGLEVLKTINLKIPNIVDGEKNQSRTFLIEDLMAIDGERKYKKPALSAERLKIVKKLTKADNKWVKDKYFPKEKSLFAPVKAASSAEFSQDDILAETTSMIAEAYNRLYAQKKLLNETTPLINSMQNQINKTIPDLKMVGRRINRTPPLVDSAREKLEQIVPLIEITQERLDTAFELLETVQGKLDNVEPIMTAIDKNIDKTPQMLTAIKTKLDNILPILQGLQDQYENTPEMIGSSKSKISESTPVLADARKKLDQVRPALEAVQTKLANIQPILDAIQDNLATAEPGVSSVQANLDDTSPVLKAMHSKLISNRMPED